MSRSTGSRDRSPSADRRQGAPARRAPGFTLLEVLVAVAILAVALGVLLQTFSTGLRSVASAERRTIATLLAESKLAAIGIETPLEAGETSGEFERGYRWLATVRPYLEPGRANGDAAERGAARVPEAFEVVVTVTWSRGLRGQGSVSLATLRLGDAR